MKRCAPRFAADTRARLRRSALALTAVAALVCACEQGEADTVGTGLLENTLGGACICEDDVCLGASSPCSDELTCAFGECVAEECSADFRCTTPNTVCTIFGNQVTTFYFCTVDD